MGPAYSKKVHNKPIIKYGSETRVLNKKIISLSDRKTIAWISYTARVEDILKRVSSLKLNSEGQLREISRNLEWSSGHREKEENQSNNGMTISKE